MPSIIFGDQFDPVAGMNFADASNAYANHKKNWITFNYVFAGESEAVSFKAFITDYKDNYEVTWNQEQVYGRNDPIVTFQNTVRSVTLSWVAPAASMEEGWNNLKRAAKLMRYCYPSYEFTSQAQTIAKPPLVRVKFKNFMKNQNGRGLLTAIGGFDFAPVIEDGFFDPPVTGQESKKYGDALIPKTLAFSCTMKILHERGIGWTVHPPSAEALAKAKAKGEPVKVAYSHWHSDASYPFMPKGKGVALDNTDQTKYEALGGAWVTVYEDVKKTTLDYWKKRATEIKALVGSNGMDLSEEQSLDALVLGDGSREDIAYAAKLERGARDESQHAQREQQVKEMQALGTAGRYGSDVVHMGRFHDFGDKW